MAHMEKTWWKHGIIYQIYPRSFQDSNGDGIGDLRGIISRLDYIKRLGIDIIWLGPVYQSPNDDNGYDISNYYQIMEEFGTLQDFDVLLEEVHNREMRLLMDLVVNHTSDEHQWFQESRKSKDNPYRDYYIWKPPVKGKEPSNWPSFFGGSAWEYDELTGEYYLHLFTRKQPDLNWENPKVRQEVYNIMKYWLDKGVDGFRMDVISLLSKHQHFPDVHTRIFQDIIQETYANGPRIHEFLQEMYEEVLKHYDAVSIGEGVGIGAEMALEYVGKDRKELNMIYHFGHMFIDHGPKGRMDPVPFKLAEFYKVFETWDNALADEGWGSVYLGNHDFPRLVSRFGDERSYWKESAKLLATLLLTLRGTPTIYQGDEIGMTNVPFNHIEDYRDVELLNAYKEFKAKSNGQFDEGNFVQIAQKQGRDNARTPMQWNGQSYGGFSSQMSWIKVNPNYSFINVEEQEEDPDSILHYYRALVQYRKQDEIWVYGDQRILGSGNEHVYVFERTLEERKRWVFLNFSSASQGIDVELPEEAELVVSNYADGHWKNGLRPWEARIYHL